MSSDYSGLQNGCVFSFSIDFSMDKTTWIGLGNYEAPTNSVSTSLPIGLCGSTICSTNPLVEKRIKDIENAKWKKAAEEIRDWLEDGLRKEQQASDALKEKIESSRTDQKEVEYTKAIEVISNNTTLQNNPASKCRQRKMVSNKSATIKQPNLQCRNFYTLGGSIMSLKDNVDVTNFYGLIIRIEAIKNLSISKENLNDIMESKPLDQNDFLVSYGPRFGKEASDEFIRRLEKIGLKYVDDFFVFEGDFPEWISFSVKLNSIK
jgi:hypothetical protein